MARLMFMPIEFSPMAGFRVSRGTSWGTTACQAGARNAAPVPLANMSRISSVGVICPRQTTSARMPPRTHRPALIAMSIRRLSRRSASVPASSAKRNTGMVVAACTSVTRPGLGSSVVISQPAPTSRIHVPTLEIRVAVQSRAKARCANGANAPGAEAVARLAVGDIGQFLLVVFRAPANEGAERHDILSGRPRVPGPFRPVPRQCCVHACRPAPRCNRGSPACR